jgi:nucleoside-diphosphate-sugar epimerase
VTGAGGFVGRALVPALERAGLGVRTAGRAELGAVGPDTKWREALAGIDAVVHLAARVHVMKEDAAAAEAEYDRVNHLGTVRLAEAAAQAGVRRLVFLSSVKVNGEATGEKAFAPEDTPAPVDAYGRSKLAAERALAEIAAAGRLEAITLRPPLVYGPGVKANFLALLRLCAAPWPLPFGAVDNRRSLVFVGNLADAIVTCLGAETPTPFATYLVRDDEDLSTAALIRRIRAAMGRPAGLVGVPPRLLDSALRALGRGALADRLLSSLQVDDRAFRRDFRWRPPFVSREALAETVSWYHRDGR